MSDIKESEFVLIRRTARIIELEPKIRALKEKIELLNVRKEIEDYDFSADIKELQEKIDELNSEKSQMEEEASSDEALKHPVLQLIENTQTIRDRVSKLEKKRSEVSQSVFERLYGEYKEKLAAAENEFSQELDSIRSLQNTVREKKERLNEELEEITVRKDLGEFDDESYEQKVAELKQAQENHETLFSDISAILEFLQQGESP